MNLEQKVTKETKISGKRVARSCWLSRSSGGQNEDIAVHLVPLDKVPAWLKRRQRQGLLVDPEILAGLDFAQQVVPSAGKMHESAAPRKPVRPKKGKPVNRKRVGREPGTNDSGTVQIA